MVGANQGAEDRCEQNRSSDVKAGLSFLADLTMSCHSEPFAVILSEAKDLALGAQGKFREESRSGLFFVNSEPNQIEIPRFARNDSWPGYYPRLE
jgi:hypothetical protein